MLFIFDMGGVVTSNAGNKLYEDVSNFLSISQERFFEASGDMLEKLEIGEISVREYWNNFSNILGRKISGDLFRVLFHPEKIVETYDLIQLLKDRKHRVVCGTNTIESHYDNHICRGDYEVFDMTYTSVNLGVAKPDLCFWEKIMKIEKVSPEQCVFIDDKIENVEAAKKLGIKAFLFTSTLELKALLAEQNLI